MFEFEPSKTYASAEEVKTAFREHNKAITAEITRLKKRNISQPEESKPQAAAMEIFSQISKATANAQKDPNTVAYIILLASQPRELREEVAELIPEYYRSGVKRIVCGMDTAADNYLEAAKVRKENKRTPEHVKARLDEAEQLAAQKWQPDSGKIAEIEATFKHSPGAKFNGAYLNKFFGIEANQ